MPVNAGGNGFEGGGSMLPLRERAEKENKSSCLAEITNGSKVDCTKDSISCKQAN